MAGSKTHKPLSRITAETNEGTLRQPSFPPVQPPTELAFSVVRFANYDEHKFPTSFHWAVDGQTTSVPAAFAQQRMNS